MRRRHAYAYHVFPSVVVHVVQIHDFMARLIDPESDSPVGGDDQAPPRRSPVSMWAFHAGTLKSSVASSIATRKVTIVRTFPITDADNSEVSSRSKKRRNPLWATLRIFT